MKTCCFSLLLHCCQFSNADRTAQHRQQETKELTFTVNFVSIQGLWNKCESQEYQMKPNCLVDFQGELKTTVIQFQATDQSPTALSLWIIFSDISCF